MVTHRVLFRRNILHKKIIPSVCSLFFPRFAFSCCVNCVICERNLFDWNVSAEKEKCSFAVFDNAAKKIAAQTPKKVLQPSISSTLNYPKTSKKILMCSCGHVERSIKNTHLCLIWYLLHLERASSHPKVPIFIFFIEIFSRFILEPFLTHGRGKV